MEQVDSLRTGQKFKKTEIGEVPVDWEVLNLNSVSNEIYRYPTYYNIEYVKVGIPEIRGELIKPNGVLETDMSKYRFISQETARQFPRTCLREGDFVISVRGTMGKVAIIPRSLDGANMTANLMRISPDRNKIFPLFLHQVLISDNFQKNLNITSSSTTIKTIKAPELKRLKFAIPPLPKQKKIAEILSTVDETIEKSNEIIKKTRELKKGLMQELLTSGIGHKKFKKTEIGEIPVDWKVSKLEKFVSITSGEACKYSKEAGEFPYPVYGSNGIVGYYNKFNFADGFVIGRVGASGSIQVISTPVWATDNTLLLSINKEFINKIYLHYYLHRCSLPQLATKTAQPLLTQKLLKSVMIAIPPSSEQKRIAEILSAVDEEIEKETANKEKLEQTKKGLMQVLLTGKKRV
jgi:type I restriction enzyme S subunit